MGLTSSAINPLQAAAESTHSDETLVDRFQGTGCRDSVDELVRRHLGRVRAMIFPMVLDHAAADDLTQETFVRAWRGLNAFRGDAKFSTWLTRIAWNVVQDEMEHRKRIRVDSRPTEFLTTTVAPDRALLDRELDEQIEVALAALSPKLRAAIVLTSLRQLSPEEAADLENCTVATMYWRVHEARRLLEHRLSKYLRF